MTSFTNALEHYESHMKDLKPKEEAAISALLKAGLSTSNPALFFTTLFIKLQG